MKTTYTTKTATYTITTQTNRRVVTFQDGAPVWGETTQYNILKDGEMVRFCFEEDRIQEMIEWHEWAEAHPVAAADMNNRFD